ncbi:hypothetical protein VFPPC_18126 [Pochonia chlamydosporia 170]|uniref:Uncharacterized protein n=1 Tax=Pochonia chlamydosporia 170 TaxID=1380566 RepID=A0A219APK4_METCM|nr:hypothetical protein VFPPC_18126 [Pochonia chlamydosporia 170]OWT42713.1 hypothetical protein VFPPC_18126 [Pochonia chlamydosporia 170]
MKSRMCHQQPCALLVSAGDVDMLADIIMRNRLIIYDLLALQAPALMTKS